MSLERPSNHIYTDDIRITYIQVSRCVFSSNPSEHIKPRARTDLSACTAHELHLQRGKRYDNTRQTHLPDNNRPDRSHMVTLSPPSLLCYPEKKSDGQNMPVIQMDRTLPNPFTKMTPLMEATWNTPLSGEIPFPTTGWKPPTNIWHMEWHDQKCIPALNTQATCRNDQM